MRTRSSLSETARSVRGSTAGDQIDGQNHKFQVSKPAKSVRTDHAEQRQGHRDYKNDPKHSPPHNLHWREARSMPEG